MRTSIANIESSREWFKNGVGIWLLYIIVCALGLSLFGCNYAELRNVTINNQPAHKGEPLGVEVNREGEQIETQLNMPLEKGDEVKTSPGITAKIDFINKKADVIMMPETYITIESIRLWFGKIIATIRGSFKVKTESLTASAGSSLFVMSVDKNDQSTVTMVDGSVVLTSNENRWPAMSIQSGQEARIFRGDRPRTETMSTESYNAVLQFVNEKKQSLEGTRAPVLIPKVIGLPQEQAERILVSAGLQIGKISKTIEGDSPIGTVVRQQPEGGKSLKRGRSVDIWVRARAVIVPNVIGQYINQARNMIQVDGLVVHGNVKEKITGKYNTGVVNDQSPRAGQRVVEGAEVSLTVEAESVEVPYVIGMSVEQAESRIRQERLRARTTTSGLDPDIRIPQVVGQVPAPGERVKPGITVTLNVANPGVRVPNLVGQREDAARRLLAGANLQTGYVSWQWSPQYPANVVMSQSPQMGQVVERNSSVALTVSKGRQPKSWVPNLIGQHEDVARRLLAKANLRVGSVSRQQHEKYPAGVVMYQSPAPGQEVEPGSAVNFTVSTGPPPSRRIQ